jgi:L-ascorbate metabolism protein UlaG (beta-lactamase superfamily)
MKHSLLKFSILFFIINSFIIKSEINAGTDSLKYIMHSFLKIKTSEGKILYIDPALVNSFEDSADVVLITHEHGDHNDLNRVKRKSTCVVIRAANALKNGVYQTITVDNIVITAVPAYNSNHPKNASVGYIVEFDGIKIYHPGDTGKITEMADLAALNIDYAFFPMDGTYTMTPEQATEAAVMINAKHDIPIHTLPGYAGYSDAMVARFTSPNKLVLKPDTTIALVKSTSSVKEPKGMPQGFKLEQNYPNPFNPTTNIRFTIATSPFNPSPYQGEGQGERWVTLRVYDTLGNEVATLVNEEKPAGNYEVEFNGSNLVTGIYFYKLELNGEKFLTNKMLYLK